MVENTGIDWTDHTWNPWQGCRKVSPGCLNCYMYRDKKRFKQDATKVVRSKNPTFNFPFKLPADPAKVFVCSWSDFFIEDADDWRDDAWDIIRRTPHLTYQLLTKRPENILDRLPSDWMKFANVWLGTTVENQEMTKRIPILLSIYGNPSIKRFISVEPMVGPVWIENHYFKGECMADCEAIMGIPCVEKDVCSTRDPGLDWVICGGESGPGARRMRHLWALDLKNQCAGAGVPFFMKQMTKKEPIPDYLQGREFPNE